MTVDELQVLITANTSALRKELNNVQNQLNGLQKTATKASNGISKSMLNLKNIVNGLGIGYALKEIGSSMSDAVSRLDTLNNYTKVMSNLGVNSDDANASIARLSDALMGLPTTLDDAVMSVQRLTSANNNVKASTEMFLAMNNAILAGGANAQTQASALEQLSQAYAKGRPDMMEWRTAMQAMPAQLNQVAVAMGYVSSSDLGEALRTGKVSMNEFMVTLTKLNKEGINGFQSFEEQARNATGGVATSMLNVKTAITRGLAEIMNAIGQSNIAGFFQAITRAINGAIPYIVAFVKVCVTAVNAISKLFGGKGLATTQKNAGSAGASLSSLGSSANNTASGLDNATGSAKKLNKELHGLASFDEMNVLKENDASGSGGGAGGGAGTGAGDLGNIDLSGFDSALSSSNSKVDEIYEKLLALGKWFISDMDFQPLVDSFYNLGDAISYVVSGFGGLLKDFIAYCIKPLATYVINDALPHFFNSTADALRSIDFPKISDALNNFYASLLPFGKSIGDGLLWFYDNVLIPLGQWTINDVVPAFLNILTGALDMVNQAITVIQPIFQWFWDNFLQPIASWTGGVIVDILNGIGDALQWIASNELAITLLESLGIAIGIVTGALTLWNIAVGIWSAVGGIATAVTTAFGVALNILLSPITLVIAAIAAVIAIIILCVKHFDTIKEVALTVWNKIKEIWQTVATWFNDNVIQPIVNFFKPLTDWFGELFGSIKDTITSTFEVIVQLAKGCIEAFKLIWGVVATWFNNTVVQPIKTIFGGAWDALKNGASKAWEGIKSIFSKVADFFKNTFSNAWNAVKNVFSTGGKIFNGIKDGIVNAFKAIVNAIIGGINKVIATPFNAINGVLDKIRNISILGAKPFKGVVGRISVPQIPKLARGGVIDNPTIAMVGEAGKEAIVPLERTEWIDKLADKINQTNDGQPIQLVVKIGEDTILDKVIDGIKDKNFETNGEVFNL